MSGIIVVGALTHLAGRFLFPDLAVIAAGYAAFFFVLATSGQSLVESIIAIVSGGGIGLALGYSAGVLGEFLFGD